MLPQLAAGWGMIDIPSVDPWFWDRFRGWSSNPNQLALLCAVLAFTSIHLADTAERFGSWIALAASCALFVWVGRLTKADTFTFSLAAGGGVFIAMKLWQWLCSTEPRPTLRPAIAVIAIVAIPLMVASTIPLAVTATTDSEDVALGLMKNGGKEAAQEADLRLQLWQEAIDRGIHAGLLGLGPGPHLPIPPSIIAGRMTEPDLGINDHPSVNGTPNFEAHNTPLDLFTQGGLLALLSFLWIMASALLTAYRSRFAGLAALLSGLAVFGMTDLIVRQPIFWFGITLCLAAAEVISARVAITSPHALDEARMFSR
jgi:O-antigen ligase